MNGIIQQLQSPVFWFAVVFVGLLVNVIGYFLSSYIKNILSKWSASYGAKRLENDKKYRETVRGLASAPEMKQVLFGFRIVYRLVLVSMIFVVAIVCLVGASANPLYFVPAFFGIFIGIPVFGKVQRDMEILYAVIVFDEQDESPSLADSKHNNQSK